MKLLHSLAGFVAVSALSATAAETRFTAPTTDAELQTWSTEHATGRRVKEDEIHACGLRTGFQGTPSP